MPNPPLIDAAELREYLAEALPPEGMARVEKALRDSAELRAVLELLRGDGGEGGLHSLGAIWRRNRLSCPPRQQWGSYLLDALDPEYSEYLTFHLDVIECPFCLANVADLRDRANIDEPGPSPRQARYFHSSRHLLSNDG